MNVTSSQLDRLAGDYYLSETVTDHHIEHWMQLASAPLVLDQVPAGARVLAMGQGDGLMTQAMLDRGFDLELLEGSARLCEAARQQHGDRLRVHCAMFEDFVAPEAYDCVLALHVMEHVADPVLTFRQAAGWLKPGGTLIAVVPNRHSMHRRVALRMGLIAALDELSDRDHRVGHLRVYSLNLLAADLLEAGLPPEFRFGYFLKTLPNSMMLDFPQAMVEALVTMAGDVPPDLLANIGIRARKPLR